MDIGPKDFASPIPTSERNKEVQFSVGASESSDVLDNGGVDAPLSVVDDEDVYYPMKRRGMFVLFNHQNFDCRLPSRKGTSVDKDQLSAVWKKLGFDVRIHDELTKKKIDQMIDQYSANDAHKKYDCFACAFMTHGEAGDYIYAKDQKYCLREILDKFKHCDSLVGKPKLFFIQACRGRKMDDGKIPRVCSDAVDSSPLEEVQEEVKIPTESDVLIFYSTVEEYFSWRNQEKGSWFVQKLVSCLEKYWKRLDLLQILTLVNKEVGKFTSDSDMSQTSGKKQSPSIVSRLTHLVRFEENEISGKISRETTEEDIPDSKAPLQSRISSGSVFESARSRDLEKEEYYRMKLSLLEMKKNTIEMQKKSVEMEKRLCEMKINALN